MVLPSAARLRARAARSTSGSSGKGERVVHSIMYQAALRSTPVTIAVDCPVQFSALIWDERTTNAERYQRALRTPAERLTTRRRAPKPKQNDELNKRPAYSRKWRRCGSHHPRAEWVGHSG